MGSRQSGAHDELIIIIITITYSVTCSDQVGKIEIVPLNLGKQSGIKYVEELSYGSAVHDR